MEVQTLWLLILGAATPIAGVVGFAIQLRQVKKARLENEKLQLEIAALKLASEQRAQLLQPASLEEIERYGKSPVMLSRRSLPNSGPDAYQESKSVGGWLAGAAFLGLFLLVVAYAAYDLYRLVRWLSRAL